MIKNSDGSTILTELEMKSLRKVVSSCRTAISRLVSDGDFLGWDNYYALGMWKDKLKGKTYELSYYVDEGEGENKSKSKTVDEWLEAYGKARKRT